MKDKTRKEHLAGGRGASEPSDSDHGQPDWEALVDGVRDLPNLETQKGKGGRVVAYARLFNPTSGSIWYATYAELGIM